MGVVVEHNISTHILTKRMTMQHERCMLWESNFNSHPHEEDDYPRPFFPFISEYFNSHPHEEDDRLRN